jgi:hypothetical protein
MKGGMEDLSNSFTFVSFVSFVSFVPRLSNVERGMWNVEMILDASPESSVSSVSQLYSLDRETYSPPGSHE